MSQARTIWCWDTLGWIKVLAWFHVVGCALFSLLSVMALASLVKASHLSHPHSANNGSETWQAIETIAFLSLVLILFLGIVGVGMGTILLRGTQQLLENERYLKSWILYVGTCFLLVLGSGIMIGVVGIYRWSKMT